MSESASAPVGTVGWVDLTVDAAGEVRDFYREVVGFSSTDVDMGDYSDFCVGPPGGDSVAGICHARGSNAGLPTAWLVYFVVEDVDASIARCRERGGELVAGPKGLGDHGRYCVIRDPAGAVCALYSEA